MTIEKTFLTLEEAKEKADYYFEYKEGVYNYKQDGKWTLVQHGKMLYFGVYDPYWWESGVYEYETSVNKHTLVIDGVIVAAGVDSLWWHGRKLYDYKINGKWFVVANGITTERVLKDLKTFVVKDGITTEI